MGNSFFEEGENRIELHFAFNEGRAVAFHAVISGQKVEGGSFIGFMTIIADQITFRPDKSLGINQSGLEVKKTLAII